MLDDAKKLVGWPRQTGRLQVGASRGESRAAGHLKIWSHPPESNWRPTDYESVALPTELGWLICEINKFSPRDWFGQNSCCEYRCGMIGNFLDGFRFMIWAQMRVSL